MSNQLRYDRSKSYQWNYDHSPEPADIADTSRSELKFQFCGLPVASPLGVAAGPLLNGRWLLHYARAGFDVLTYKTVRSRTRECYPLPNLVPVPNAEVTPGGSVRSSKTMDGSWAISFGMPSAKPQTWSADIERTRASLPHGCVLSVSVVATPEDDWSLDQIADDYAACAKLATESGADCIEANFSCPNVASRDGQLYQNPTAARTVAQRLRAAIGNTPLVLKIGCVESPELAGQLVQAVSDTVTALAMTNCIGATVHSGDEPLFAGQVRGIGGDAIRQRSIAQVAMFSKCIADNSQSKLQIVGVGGVSSAPHAQEYLAAGAHAVHLATAAMLDTTLAQQIKRKLNWCQTTA